MLVTALFVSVSPQAVIYSMCVCMFEQAVFDGEKLALPWRYDGLKVVSYGNLMLELKSENGYTLSFNPQSNEFTIMLPSSTAISQTAGLCGNNNTEPYLLIKTTSISPETHFYFTQAPVGRRRLMTSPYGMAAQQQISRLSSLTGRLPRMVVCVYRDRGQCVHPEQHRNVRPCARRCLCRAMIIYPSKRTSPGVRSSHVWIQMCAS